jgi:hypothetical protein
LEQCQIDCGSGCSICGQVWTYCVENGFISANYTISACLTIDLDNIPTSLGFCPFSDSILECCDNPIPPVTPPVEPPVLPPIPLPPQAQLNCTDNNEVAYLLGICQVACGTGCQYCGEVFSYCEMNGIFGSNYTLDTCMTVSLDYLPVSSGCPYNASLSSCCGLPGPAPETCVNNTAVEEQLVACQLECGTTACPYCSDVFSYCIFNGNISTNFTINACLTINLDYISTGFGVCPFGASLPTCCNSLVPPIAPPIVEPIAPPVTPAELVDCLDNLAVTALLDACQVACGPGCDYCGQVFSYCMENGFILANYTLDACNVIYLDFIPTSAGACPFNDTLTFCCGEVQPPVPVIPTAVPVTPPPTPVVNCLDNPTVVTVLDACQTLCGAECDYCGQVYTYCSDAGLLIGNFTIDACLVINLDFIPTSVGACPFNDTLTACCTEVEPPVPILRNQENKHYQQKKHDWDESKCSLYKYTEAYYCIKAYNDLSCEDRLVKCKDYVIKSVENDESKHCLMNRISHSSDSETCHFEKAITDCCA